MNQFYTAVGRLKINRQYGSKTPSVMLGCKEYQLDVQEMLLWSVMNWRILSKDELRCSYEKALAEEKLIFRRSMEECMRRLLQRGLIAEGIGETGADALYELLSELYIIPISENPLLRLISFVRFTFFQGISYSVTRRIFGKDKRNDSEKKVMRIVNQAVLSTAEIIKCFQQKVFDFSSEDTLMDALYFDTYTTSDNISEETRYLPECRPVLASIANLYLRRQIIFERV